MMTRIASDRLFVQIHFQEQSDRGLMMRMCKPQARIGKQDKNQMAAMCPSMGRERGAATTMVASIPR
jgi:hypothetical protein